MSKTDLLQNACYWLNYHARMKESKTGKRPYQFTPCARSVVLIQGNRDNKEISDIINEAVYNTSCQCHPNMTPEILLCLMGDDRAKIAYSLSLDPSKIIKTQEPIPC